jgi:hypothetical protein
MGERRSAYRVLVGNLRERNPLENTHVNGRIILKRYLGKGWRVLDWIGLAQYRDRWQAVVYTVMNLRVP